MKYINTVDAVGHVLCHDMTQIIRGQTKDARFRKGHVVTDDDITVLLSMGKDTLYVWEATPGMLHENDAAKRLADICENGELRRSDVKEGKIDLFAQHDGLFCVDIVRLEAINAIDQLMIATRGHLTPVKLGDKLAGTRVIPLLIDENKLNVAKTVAGDIPLMQVKPYHSKKCGIVTTGNEVFHGRIKDTFSPVVEEKLREFGGQVLGTTLCGDKPEDITKAIHAHIKEGAELVCCTGGMSVDPDDRTPVAIRDTGANIISYGAPVLPGAMFMLSYLGNIPIVGLPGCVMYAKRTIFDLMLPRLMADVPVTRENLSKLGNGGLCLDCDQCHFPNCGFGRGV